MIEPADLRLRLTGPVHGAGHGKWDRSVVGFCPLSAEFPIGYSIGSGEIRAVAGPGPGGLKPAQAAARLPDSAPSQRVAITIRSNITAPIYIPQIRPGAAVDGLERGQGS